MVAEHEDALNRVRFNQPPFLSLSLSLSLPPRVSLFSHLQQILSFFADLMESMVRNVRYSFEKATGANRPKEAHCRRRLGWTS